MAQALKSRTSATPLLIAIAAIVLFAAAAIAGVLFWSAQAVNAPALERERSIVALVLAQSVGKVAHDQEGSTLWDDSVRQLRKPELDYEWLDDNLGIWFHGYFGHNETYIVDAADRPLYAMREGKRVDARLFDVLAPTLKPLIATLRTEREPQKLRDGQPPLMSAGATDLALVRGRPAIISAKPVVSDSGEIVQEPGSEPVHISVAYLDRGFVERLNSLYSLDHGRFSLRDDARQGETSLRLKDAQNRTIGYLVWQPFAPGTKLSAKLGPALLAGLAIVAIIVTFLAMRLRRGALALRASEAQAQHLAFHDALTGLPNRALFEDRLDHALAGSRRTGKGLALLYVDLDRFKQINDTLGHPAGDALIREVAQRLAAAVRQTDTVARLGGDEFAIIQTDIHQLAEVEILCMRIVEQLSESFSLTGATCHVGASIGVSMAPDDGLDRVELTRKADIALYRSKAEGRGRYCFFTAIMDETIRVREEIERDLRIALDTGDQLRIDYQPVFASDGRALMGVEALVRWHHPEKGLIPPGAFIPLAEETGLIERLGHRVLRTACRDALRWERLKLSVNVSPVQLRNREFARQVAETLRDTGFDPARLELEITETALLDPSDEVIDNIRSLRDLGVRLALDDFGTGYSSLTHLQELNVDRVKIDQSFVKAIDINQGGSPIIRAIVNLAQTIGLEVTAEGVETCEQSNFLTSIGCEELQGFLLGRPVASGEIDRMVDDLQATPAPR